MPTHFRVLSHWGEASAVQLPVDLLDRVEVIPISADGPMPAGVFDVLLTFGSEVDNLGEILDSGVPWVHVTATGVDEFPVEILGDAVLDENVAAPQCPSPSGYLP